MYSSFAFKFITDARTYLGTVRMGVNISSHAAVLQVRQAAPPPDADVGWPCTDDSSCVTVDCAASSNPDQCMTEALKERYDRDNLSLACDPSSNTCQLSCESDVECPGGFTCYDASEDGNSYCVNPTCSLN